MYTQLKNINSANKLIAPTKYGQVSQNKYEQGNLNNLQTISQEQDQNIGEDYIENRSAINLEINNSYKNEQTEYQLKQVEQQLREADFELQESDNLIKQADLLVQN